MIVTDMFLPFFGVVEDINDPEQAGRLRVRCYGYHPENKGFISTDMLRWFSSIMSNSAGVSGIGQSPTGYVTGSTVFGYFLNKELQDGIVIGSIPGKPTANALASKGFNDPEGVYPIYVDESDVNRLARGDHSHWIFNIRANARMKQMQKPFKQGEYEEPEYVNNAEYPKNNVLETTSGHIREFDDTPEQERIHEYHRSGTYYSVDADGTRVVKIVGDGYEIIAGDKFANVSGTVNLTISGDVNQYVKGNYNLQIDGNKTEVVLGEVKEYYARKQATLASGGVAIDGATIDLNSGKAAGNSSVQLTLPKEYSIETATPVIESGGKYAASDEQSEIGSTPSEFPEDKKPEGYTGDPITEIQAKQEEKITGELSMCSTIIKSKIDYDMELGSSGFTIGQLSSECIFPNKIKAQGGFTEQEIVCNLQAISEKILSPLKEEFGEFGINSGFRVGSGRSQHNIGQAVDIQEPSWSYEKYNEVLEWMANNLPVDQLIIEHGNKIWIHVSFDPSKDKQRGQLLTMINGTFEEGLKNYYA